MYPHDNIFNIYYNIGKRTPFLVKRCELGLARSSSEERRIDPNRDRTFLVETVKPRGKYGKAYGKCFMNGKPDDTYGEFYQFNLSSCIRQQNSLTAQFVSFSLANLANIFYPPDFYNN